MTRRFKIVVCILLSLTFVAIQGAPVVDAASKKSIFMSNHVKNIRVKPTASFIKITWDKVDYENGGYLIYRATSKAGTYEDLGCFSEDFLDDTVEYGKTYYYKVVAQSTFSGEHVTSKFSDIIKVTAKLPAPNLSITTNANKVTVSMKRISHANGYVIYRTASKNGNYTEITNITLSKKLSYTTDVAPGKTYYYKARAYNLIDDKVYWGAYSEVKEIAIQDTSKDTTITTTPTSAKLPTYVTLGSYPMYETFCEGKHSNLEYATYDENNETVIDGIKYRRILDAEQEYHYYKYAKIGWNVIGYQDGKLYLLSDETLDGQIYDRIDSTDPLVTWEECGLRTWLNDTFLNTAFTEQEKDKLVTMSVENNTSDGTLIMDGNTTRDKVTLLSYDEFCELPVSKKVTDEMSVDDIVIEKSPRLSRFTDYAKANGIEVRNVYHSSYAYYWLRSLGTGTYTDESSNPSKIPYVGIQYTGDENKVNTYGPGSVGNVLGVRPVICVNLADVMK